jgi:hypothetical protein
VIEITSPAIVVVAAEAGLISADSFSRPMKDVWSSICFIQSSDDVIHLFVSGNIPMAHLDWPEVG